MPPGTGLVLGLGMNGVATGGGTYPEDTCKGKHRGDALREGGHPLLISPPLLRDPRLFYYPAPYPGFEGVVLGHVIQQRGQRVDLQVNTAHFLPGLEGQGSEHPSQSSLVTPIPSGVSKDSSPQHRSVTHPTSPKAALQDHPTCDGTWVGASGPPSSTSGGGGEGKMSSSRGAGGNGSSIIGGGGGGNAPPRAPSESSPSPIGGGGGKGKSR